MTPLPFDDLLFHQSRQLGLVVAVAIGFGFGFVLERAGFGRATKLAAQFYGHDMTVFKVMFGAIVTAALGTVIAGAVGLIDLGEVARHAASWTYLWPMLAGGLLLGAGFIVAGYCPGTSVVAAASGNVDGLVTLVGVGLGCLLFVESYPLLGGFLESGNLGHLFLYDLLPVPPAVAAAAVAAMAIGGFVAADSAERYFAARYGIDPEYHIWGWDVSLYLFLGGIGAGIMILTALLGMRRGGEPDSRWVRWMPLTVPLLISVGMAALLWDLDYKLHVYRFFLAFVPGSPMSWGSWLLLVVYPTTILLGLAGLDDAELERVSAWGPIRATGLGAVLRRVHRWSRGRAGSLRWISLVVGVGLGIYTGILLGALGARPAWNSALLGPLFLVSGFSTGAALMMLFPVAEREHHALLRWDMIAIAVEVALLALFLIGLGSGVAAGRGAAALFLGGPFTATFWGLVIATGLVVPFTLEATEIRLGLRATLAAPLLILAGGAALRFIIVAAGQI